MKVAIAFGEQSGQNLANKLIAQFADYKDVEVLSYGNLELLAVTGIWEPLLRLPKIWAYKNQLIQELLAKKIDVFVGIDAPDFNLRVAKELKAHGIFTVQYVSPSVWAWRKNRIHYIKKAIDLVLTLFPFELKIYKEHQIKAFCVGHPLVADISPNTPSSNTMALMPGSRDNELKYLLDDFLKAAVFIYRHNQAMSFLLPVISQKHQALVEARIKAIASHVPIKIVVDKTAQVLSQVKCALVASGTASLEVALYNKPLVVAYRLHPITYYLLRWLLTIPFISLPNLILNKEIVPEYIQHFTAEQLGDNMLKLLHDTRQQKSFATLRQLLLTPEHNAARIIYEQFNSRM